jgi:hypothetical protein
MGSSRCTDAHELQVKASDFIAWSLEILEDPVELVFSALSPPQSVPESAKNRGLVHILKTVPSFV